MPLDAHIIDPVTEEIDREWTAQLSSDQHHVLFTLPEVLSGHFPLLSRFDDYHADATYSSDELEALISEVERVATLSDFHPAIVEFTGPFHTLCCVAYAKGRHVTLLAD